MNTNLLAVKELTVNFQNTQVLKGVSFSIQKGEIVGLVGQSGSGKSVLSRTILGLEETARIAPESSIEFQSSRLGSVELTKLDQDQFRKIRGSEISMIFQEPKAALNPVLTCGFQIREVIKKALTPPGSELDNMAIELLQKVGMGKRFLGAYPFQISGGEAQRIMIAMATAASPAILLADEPTTSLDPGNEEAIIQHLLQINKEFGTAVLLVSHDELLIKRIADRCLYINQGKLTETEQHPVITQGIKPGNAHQGELLLSVESLRVDKIRDRKLRAPILKGVDFNLYRGETLGVVGSSGSGKSTLARCLLQLIPDYHGKVILEGNVLSDLSPKELKKLRRDIQIIFQDPLDSLNPRIKVGQALMEVLKVHRMEEDRKSREKLIQAIMSKVHLSSDKLDSYPHQLSGGERQRICIARALLLQPSLLVLDEPVTSLDSSVRHEILQELIQLKDEYNLTYIFISHDLRLVNFMCDKVLVLKEGSIVEQGPVFKVFKHPTDEYTRSLLQKLNNP